MRSEQDRQARVCLITHGLEAKVRLLSPGWKEEAIGGC